MPVPYLDHAATTPVDARVLAAMLDVLGPDGAFGNPASSTHLYGRAAQARVAQARAQVAALLGAQPREILFTSGATESNNLALKGVALAHAPGHIVTSAIEHRAVLDPCRWLARQGHALTEVAPDAAGRITPEAVAAALRPDTFLVSVMHANNETGVINDIAAIAALCRDRGLVFHVDAAQSAGKIAIDVDAVPVDLLSISGHKLYAPKGIGALYVRRRPGLTLQAQLHGGGQEQGLRAGTLATHQIVGLGAASALAHEQMAADAARQRPLRDRLQQALLALGGVRVNGAGARLPGHLNLAFDGVDGELMQKALVGIAVSAGSACTSASPEPSHVLRAMGVAPALAAASLRFSLGRGTDDADIDVAIDEVSRVVRALRR